MNNANLGNNLNEQEPLFEDARIIRVLIKYLEEPKKKRIIIIGPRDVGKTLYVNLAIWKASMELTEKVHELCKSINQKQDNQDKKPIILYPIFIKCPNLTYNWKNYSPIYCGGRRIELFPIYVIDDAHLCEGKHDLSDLEGMIVLIYPSPHDKLPRGTQIQVLPFRFVEIIEILRKDIREILSKNAEHYKAENRLQNLINFDNLDKIVEKIYKKNSEDKKEDKKNSEELKEYFRLYLKYGGTAYGIEAINKALRNKTKNIPEAFLNTIDEILADAENYNYNKEAVRSLLYFLAERTFEKGLEVTENDFEKDVANLAREITYAKVEINDIKRALEYLRNSGIIIKVKERREGTDKQEDKQKRGYKLVFSDPRYAIGAYLHYFHKTQPTTYKDVYDALNQIIDNLFTDKSTNYDSINIAHYLEATFLANLALGAYALTTSLDKPNKIQPIDKAIEYLKAETEIDAVITVERRKDNMKLTFLAEFSEKYDKNHVEKCKKAIGNNREISYCLYAFLKGEKDIDKEDRVLAAPIYTILMLL